MSPPDEGLLRRVVLDDIMICLSTGFILAGETSMRTRLVQPKYIARL